MNYHFRKEAHRTTIDMKRDKTQRRRWSSVSLVSEMRVFLKNLDGHVCSIDIEPSEDCETVRVKIEQKTGIDRLG